MYRASQVQLLLEHGADPTAAEGGTPLVTEAAQQGHGAVAGLLEAQAARWRLGVRLYAAAYRGDIDSAEVSGLLTC